MFGVLGFLSALSLLPYGYGALDFEQVLEWRGAAKWGSLTSQSLSYLVAALSALLFVAGRYVGYIGAALGTVLAIGYAMALPRVELAVAASGSPEPHMTRSLVLAVGAMSIAVLAVLRAIELRRATIEAQDHPSA
jgi:hypothetical protein